MAKKRWSHLSTLTRDCMML